MELKQRIEKVLSEILTDKYDCKVTLHFEPASADQKEESKERNQSHDTI